MSKKEQIARLLDKTGLSGVFFAGRRFYGNNHIRVVNYHSTPPQEMNNFEEQLKFYQHNYSSVSYKDLVQFFETGKWHKEKPGIIISFDDGWRDNIDNAVPLLEKYNFKGWFFIPSGLVDSSSSVQMEFVGKTEGRYMVTYGDGRYLMDWEELRVLYDNHVLGCHTWTHHRMDIKDTQELLNIEITEAKQYMERMLHKPINIFCWVGGELHTYTEAAAKKIKEAGYLYSFMTNTYPLTPGQQPLQIQRTNVETRNSLAVVKFQLSIFMDMFYRKKRRKVLQITTV